MKKDSTQTSSPKRLKISDRTRALYEQRDKSLDHTDAPVLPPEMWENAVIGKYYRPIKTAVSLRIDNDVLAWHISRINDILRQAMLADQRSR